MKYKFRVEGLDCAYCTAKAERGISAIDGVENASINFMTLKMVMEFDESRYDEIMDQAMKILRRVEPEIEVTRL